MSTALTDVNQQTEWWDLSGAKTDVGFILEGDFANVVSVHYSNKPDYAKSANDYIVDGTTYSTKTSIVVAFGVARYVRFASGGSWTGGKTCTPRAGVAMDGNGRPYIPTPQDQKLGNGMV